MASLTKAEFATLCEQTRTKEIDAIRKIVEREARRIVRTRRETARQLLNDEERKML
jgi:hypothetical protein